MMEPSKRVVSFHSAGEPGERVLIVDGDGDLGGDTASALLSLGLTVSSIASATEALDIAYRYRPTVVIVDIDIGGELGGIHLGRRLAEHWMSEVRDLENRHGHSGQRRVTPGISVRASCSKRATRSSVRGCVENRPASPPRKGFTMN